MGRAMTASAVLDDTIFRFLEKKLWIDLKFSLGWGRNDTRSGHGKQKRVIIL